jgi:hypothetical protein
MTNFADVTKGTLQRLLAIGAEGPHLDYKRMIDLSKTRDTVELAKDLGAMMEQGGHLVIGADSAGNPIGGLDTRTAGLLDEATIRDKMRKYIPEPFEIYSAVHEYAGVTMAVIQVLPHVHGCCVFRADGQYQDARDPKKTLTVFQHSTIFVRHGSQSTRATGEDMARIMAKPNPTRRPSYLRPFPFWGKNYVDTRDLGAAFAERWNDVAEVVLGRDLELFINWIAARGDSDTLIQVLMGYKEGRLKTDWVIASLIVDLAPALPPSFKGHSVDEENLIHLAERGIRSNPADLSYISDLLKSRVLRAFSNLEGFADYAALEDRWQRSYEWTIAVLQRLGDVVKALDDRAIRARAAAHMLLGLLSEPARELLEKEAESAASDHAKTPSWFVALMKNKPLSPDERMGWNWLVKTLSPVALESRRRQRIEERAREAEQLRQEEEWRRHQERARVELIRVNRLDTLDHWRWVSLPGLASAILTGSLLLAVAFTGRRVQGRFQAGRLLAHTPQYWQKLIAGWPTAANHILSALSPAKGTKLILELVGGATLTAGLVGLTIAVLALAWDRLYRRTEAGLFWCTISGYLLFILYLPWTGAVLGTLVTITFITGILTLIVLVLYWIATRNTR